MSRTVLGTTRVAGGEPPIAGLHEYAACILA